MIGEDISEVNVQREIWFEKVAWSYVLCHWKGFAVMAAIIFLTIAAIIMSQMLLNSLGYGYAEWLPFVIFLIPALPFLLGLTKRHS